MIKKWIYYIKINTMTNEDKQWNDGSLFILRARARVCVCVCVCVYILSPPKDVT